jgi:hypothetical protein
VLAGAAGGATADHTEQLDEAAIRQAVAADGFPIHDYESLRATEILPMLAELDTDQLQQVRQREAAGKNRFMILSRVDDEMESRGGGAWEVDEEGWEEEEAAEVPVAQPGAATGEFPIPDYHEMGALQVLGRLNDLDAGELEAVREREQMGSRRSMVLKRIERLLAESDRRRVTVPASPVEEPAIEEEGGFDDEAPEPIVVAPVRGRRSPTTKRAAAKKATTKRTGTKRGAAKAAPATRSTATRGRAPAPAPAKRGPARKAAGAGKAAKAGKASSAGQVGATAKTARAAPAKRSAAKAAKGAPASKRSAAIKKAPAPAKRSAKRR